MSLLLNPILTLIIVYGYPIIVVIILVSYLGVPISLDAVLLAAGSFTANGTLNMFVLIALVSITSVAGDVIGYYLARKYGNKILKKTILKKGFTEARVNYLSRLLDKWGGWAIFTTRWLFTPFGLPVDLLSGITKYPFKKFLFFVVVGEFLWACIYIYLGHAFAANWQTLLEYISNLPTILLLLLIGGICFYVGLKTWRKYTGK